MNTTITFPAPEPVLKLVRPATEKWAASLAELPEAVADADIVTSSTAAPGFVLPAELVARAMKHRPARPLFLIDLALPRDVDPAAAALVGIDVDRVIAFTFFVGGFLGGAASVIYGLYINTIGFQMGFQNGLYAFTAAVLGGIGSIPGAVVGGLVIGLVRSLSSAYVGERWTGAIVFAILIVILVFRPEGLLGRGTREKV